MLFAHSTTRWFLGDTSLNKIGLSILSAKISDWDALPKSVFGAIRAVILDRGGYDVDVA